MNKGILILLGIFITFSVIILILIIASSNSTKTQSLQNSPETNSSEKSSVPLARQEDVINAFFNLINEDKVSEVVNMLTLKNIDDEANKQAWGVQFNAIDSISVKSVEPIGENAYKVTLDVLMKPGAEKAVPMPYYGWGDGEFTRFITLEKSGETWKISEIATGP